MSFPSNGSFSTLGSMAGNATPRPEPSDSKKNPISVSLWRCARVREFGDSLSSNSRAACRPSAGSIASPTVRSPLCARAIEGVA